MLTHHAYYIEGSLQQFAAYVDQVRAAAGLGAHDPNFVAQQYDTFGIDDARALQQLAQLKTTNGAALFFLAISSMTSEAQQALLKLFEEPQAGVVFVLLVPHGTLLPTLKSRCLAFSPNDEIIHDAAVATPTHAKSATVASKNLDVNTVQAKQFLAAPYKERSEMIVKMLKPTKTKAEADTENAGGDEDSAKEQARELLNALEVLLHKDIAKKEIRDALADIAHFRTYLADRSPSLKMILEHFAVTLPKL